MWTVPLLLTVYADSNPWHYTRLFRDEWYAYENDSQQYPRPLGLCLGIVSVAVGQVFVWICFYIYKVGISGCDPKEPLSVQTKGSVSYEYLEGICTHVAQPEGFGLLASYLAITWMLNLLPASYYSFEGGIQWKETATCLVIQDGIQYLMHRLEHDWSASFYQKSHKPHHRFINPRLFDAFNGSLYDTGLMILIPLYITSNIVRTTNVWSYMAFGSSYACWLTLIHSEYAFPWDGIFRRLGLGTPADHHVHHKFFKYNFGHLFMWYDQFFGTYRDPKVFAPKDFHVGV
jgi:sterol desaturase/sphingolipid hydroxylase (fatty acid hydroxylase superfamily)